MKNGGDEGVMRIFEISNLESEIRRACNARLIQMLNYFEISNLEFEIRRAIALSLLHPLTLSPLHPFIPSPPHSPPAVKRLPDGSLTDSRLPPSISPNGCRA
ncbi:MAG TPA: hypothetical protein VNO70_10965 [Blastocatellia bacterium]|nr:hypothetical protein [Blastocatellia bacterium]